MRKILLFLIVFATISSFFLGVWLDPAFAADRRSDRNKLSIMTFNAEFLWDGRSPEEGNRNVRFPWKFSSRKAARHMQDIANVISSSNPDIVNLVEVENLAALRFFNDNFLSSLDYKPYLVDGQDEFTGQDVGLLTRIDPEGERIERTNNRVRVEGETRTRGVSKNYFAKFDVDGRKFSLIGVHFLSRPPDTSRKAEREAQAEVTKSLALQLRSESFPPIVLGDLNDYDGDPESLDVGDKIPITNVLNNIRQQATFTQSDDLINVLKFVSKDKRFTSFFDRNRNEEIDSNEFSAIDHILIPSQFESLLEDVSLDQTYDPRQVSDHFPITVNFDLTRDGTVIRDESSPNTLRLVSLLPNPVGDDSQSEAVTIENTGTIAIDLNGWILRDVVGRVWKLDGWGSLAAAAQIEIRRNGQPMSMNNSGGDTIELVAPDGSVVSQITYLSTKEGVPIAA